MNNKELKKRIKDAHLYLWQVANQIGVCEMTLVRWLRLPLPQDKYDKIVVAIDELVREGE